MEKPGRTRFMDMGGLGFALVIIRGPEFSVCVEPEDLTAL